MTSEAPTLETPLWAFSLDVYGAEGVEDECLALQERLRLDVNVLLFAAYMGAVEGVELAPQDVAGAVAEVSHWHDAIVRALRSVRQTLKPLSLDERNPLHAPTADLRADVKGAELCSEKIEQEMLWLWSRRHLNQGRLREPAAALSANLQSVLAHYGAGGQVQDAAMLRRLRAAALVFQESKS